MQTVNNLSDYSSYVNTTEWFNYRYCNSGIVNTDFFTENQYVYNYTEKLNLKDHNVLKIPTGQYKNALFPNKSEIVVCKLIEPYYSFSIDYPISRLNNGNVIQMLLQYLIQFQQINYTYIDYDICKVYDDAVIRIHSQLKLLSNYEAIKTSIIEKSIAIFEESVKETNGTSIGAVLSSLRLLTPKNYYVHGFDGIDKKDVYCKAYNYLSHTESEEKILSCIELMKEAKMFVNAETVKDQLYDSGERQIKKVLKDCKEIINEYNMNTFGVKTYYQWKKRVGW